jgi:hypothetical protein
MKLFLVTICESGMDDTQYYVVADTFNEAEELAMEEYVTPATGIAKVKSITVIDEDVLMSNRISYDYKD